MLALLKTPAQYDAQQLKLAMKVQTNAISQCHIEIKTANDSPPQILRINIFKLIIKQIYIWQMDSQL